MFELSSQTVLQLLSLLLKLGPAAESCDQRKMQEVPNLKFLLELKLKMSILKLLYTIDFEELLDQREEKNQEKRKSQ